MRAGRSSTMRITTCAHTGKYVNNKPRVSNWIQLLCTRRIGEWLVRGKSIPEQDRSARPARCIPTTTTYQVLMARMLHSMTTEAYSSYGKEYLSLVVVVNVAGVASQIFVTGLAQAAINDR